MRSNMFYKPNLFLRILKIAGISLAVIAGLVLLYFLGSLGFKYFGRVKVNDKPSVTELKLELDQSITYENIASNSAMFLYNSESIKVISKDGKFIRDDALKMANPTTISRGNYTLFFDIGGHNAIVFNKTKQETTLTVQEKILMASVNNSGAVVLVTEGDLHKAVVRVYSADGKEIFKWNSGKLVVISADIADNSKELTVSALNTDEGALKNHIIMFNVTKEKPFTNDIYDTALYSVVRYDGSHLYCIGSHNTLIYNGYGKCSGTADYGDRELMHYVTADGMLILAFSGSEEVPGAYAEVKSYNHRGAETGSFTSRQAFDFIAAKDGRIVLNNGRTLSVLNGHCQEKRQLNLSIDLHDFLFTDSTGHGIGLTASGAVTIRLGS